MSHKRVFSLLVVGCAAIAIACGSDSSPTGPNRTPLFITNGPDSGSQPVPDTSGPRSTTPRSITGSVSGIGPAGDSANYSKVAGVSVTIRLPDDSAAHVRGKTVASAVTDANGNFSLGTVAPGGYIFEAIPPAGSPFKSVYWGFSIGDWSPNAVVLGVWLSRLP